MVQAGRPNGSAADGKLYVRHGVDRASPCSIRVYIRTCIHNSWGGLLTQFVGLGPVRPLSGVLIVDISRLAIPYASGLLSDMGAITIAVQPPSGASEKLRGAYHRDRRRANSVELNLKTTEGR